MTGESPYEKLGSDEVVRLYKARDFPNFTGTPCDKFIQQCWNGEIASTQEAYGQIEGLLFMYVETSCIS